MCYCGFLVSVKKNFLHKKKNNNKITCIKKKQKKTCICFRFGPEIAFLYPPAMHSPHVQAENQKQKSESVRVVHKCRIMVFLKSCTIKVGHPARERKRILLLKRKSQIKKKNIIKRHPVKELNAYNFSMVFFLGSLVTLTSIILPF